MWILARREPPTEDGAWGEGTVTAEPAGARTKEPQRELHAKEWADVHTGPAVKCVKIRFAAWEDPKKDGGQPAIMIYINGDQQANLAQSLSVGDMTEVCGKSIRVYGQLRGVQVAYWQASDDDVTDWFE